MDFIGLSRLTGKSRDGKPKLTERGLYGLVRHPMYLFSLLVMWLSPTMTVNRITLYSLISLYFFVGTFHEEILLEEEFGQDYADYRRRVPRMIPFFRRRGD
jgi:protein-S-isoprenylcysteine O-methyltransferase Ste14